MEKTKEDLLAELNQLTEKYLALEAKYHEEKQSSKQREEEQQMRMMFLEGVANSTIDGFLVVNPYGKKILQNQRTVELWKIPKEVVDDPDGRMQVAHVMNMTKNPQQFVAEINHLREHPNDISYDELELIDGTILDRYSSPVIGLNGENYGRIWSFHDITERKNLEKQLSQLNADKDRFISILAHDLRNPFSTLLGFAELLKMKLHTMQIEKIEGMVEHIYKTAVSTNELLEDTLLWARIQKTSFCPTTIKLKQVISEVLKVLEPSILEKNIAVLTSVKEELLIYTDIYMLKAILRNLIANAVKFTNYQGKIELSAFHSGSFTTIKISDNGIGINSEALKKLFNTSTHVTTKGTANETGSGLGLILCKEFIDKHSGKIWVESDVNKGTTVSFTIPDKDE